MVTVVLSIGVQRMARRHAIIRHLAAVETLGSATVIASDKTGTLTKNEMTVRVAVTASGRVAFDGAGYAPEGSVRRDGGGDIDGPLRIELDRAFAVANRANNAVVHERDGRWAVHGDPTEGALLVAAGKAGVESAALDQRLPRVGELPFSSERKLMSTVHRDTSRDRGLVLTKGAPDVLLARCSQELVGDGTRPLTPERRAEIAGGERGPRRRGAAHARRRGAAADAGRAGRAHGPAGRAPRAGSRLHRADRHHRSAPAGSAGRGRQGAARRHPAADDHRRSSADGVGDRARAGHRDRRPHAHRRRPRRADAGRGAAGHRRGVGLRAREPRTQAAHRRRAAPGRRRRGHDRRRRQRRAGAEEGRHRHRHGHHRHRRVEGGRRHGARRRRLRHHRRRRRGRPGDLRQHPQVPALPAVVEHRRGDDDVRRRAVRHGARPRRRRRRPA